MGNLPKFVLTTDVNMKHSKIIRYSDEVKEEVVNAILNGELLLKEAMEKYDILAELTIIKWVKKSQSKTKTIDV
ncbi:transposase [Sphingobacterium sp. SRCM116780]|uniref:transposase n=1 Tax=Sphingobacterium sp. SRCM116780 TaxID=2907623 RepID=UPI001F2AC8D6|nr:transposase [Sphingobacterium sp. SRCM116780]UIR56992.1 transposase [Sphingobacterium sp. SRCM116780]